MPSTIATQLLIPASAASIAESAAKAGGTNNIEAVASVLFTASEGDPDLLIRTGNTQRLSNFLLWQVAYSEIFFERKLWPDFKGKDYNKIINKYKKIKRNFGNI